MLTVRALERYLTNLRSEVTEDHMQDIYNGTTMPCSPPTWWCKKKRSKLRCSPCPSSSASTSRPWGDLPADILHDVAVQLSAKDYASFASVCQGWRSLVHPDARPMLLLLLSASDGAFTAVDPSRRTFRDAEFRELAGARVLASKGGWLLLKNDDCIFFFHPRSRSTRRLPRQSVGSCRAAFSRPPSPSSSSDVVDCVVVVLDDDDRAVSSSIRIWKSGDDSWKVFRFSNSNIKSNSGFFLHGGRFLHCVGRDGTLAMFDTSEKAWAFYHQARARYMNCEGGARDVEDGRVYMAEFDGGLYMVLLCVSRRQVRVFRMNPSVLDVVEIERLGNRTIYIDPVAAHMSFAPERAMANRIYFSTFGQSTGCFHYYCMRTRRYSSSVDFSMTRKLVELSEEWRRGGGSRRNCCFSRIWVEV